MAWLLVKIVFYGTFSNLEEMFAHGRGAAYVVVDKLRWKIQDGTLVAVIDVRETRTLLWQARETWKQDKLLMARTGLDAYFFSRGEQEWEGSEPGTKEKDFAALMEVLVYENAGG